MADGCEAYWCGEQDGSCMKRCTNRYRKVGIKVWINYVQSSYLFSTTDINDTKPRLELWHNFKKRA